MGEKRIERYVSKHNIIYFVNFIVPDLQHHSYHQDMFGNIFVR